MKKALFCVLGIFALISCSEDSIEGVSPNEETGDNSGGNNVIYTEPITSQDGYWSPYKADNHRVPQIVLKNLTNDYDFTFKLHYGPAYYDGDFEGKINYTPWNWGLYTPANSPILLMNGHEFNTFSNFGGHLFPADEVITNSTEIGVYPDPLSVGLFQKYSKLHFVVGDVSHISNTFKYIYVLKSEGPYNYVEGQPITTEMMANNFESIESVYPNFQQNYLNTINKIYYQAAYNIDSREVVFPDSPKLKSEYIFSGVNNDSLRLYFKTFPDHIEIILEEI